MVKKYLQNPKNLEPLDLAATVGPSCVCVCVCVCVKVSVEERRCGGVPLKSPRKKHTSLSILKHVPH